jgi:hypothetical protein
VATETALAPTQRALDTGVGNLVRDSGAACGGQTEKMGAAAGVPECKNAEDLDTAHKTLTSATTHRVGPSQETFLLIIRA